MAGLVLAVGVGLGTMTCRAQEAGHAVLPEAPSALLVATGQSPSTDAALSSASSASLQPEDQAAPVEPQSSSTPQQPPQTAEPVPTDGKQAPSSQAPKIRPQTGRIFGIFPNFVAVSGGTKPKPAGWKTDFTLANKQAYDYSSFGFLLLSSSFAYWDSSHPSLNTVDGGNAIFYAYLWRGFLDKTDGSYQGTFLFPALLHEDTRYYALGTGPVKKRLLHAVESIVVAHNYSGQPTFNAAALIGRAGAQAVSTVYYPAGSEGFGVLAEKYGYSTMRNVIYAVVREFSPDAQARIHFH